MRILTWNLQHGGGRRIGRIVEALRPYEADVLVLSEYRNNEPRAALRARLREEGYAKPPGCPGSLAKAEYGAGGGPPAL